MPWARLWPEYTVLWAIWPLGRQCPLNVPSTNPYIPLTPPIPSTDSANCRSLLYWFNWGCHCRRCRNRFDRKIQVSLNTMLSHVANLPNRSDSWLNLEGYDNRAHTTARAVVRSTWIRSRYSTWSICSSSASFCTLGTVNQRQKRALPAGIRSREKEKWLYSYAGLHFHFLWSWRRRRRRRIYR